MLAVFSKEFRSYFNSALGYVFMGVFLLISGIFFALSNLLPASAYYGSVLQSSTFVFLILVPVITMKTLSEERHQKTDQLLLTVPLSTPEIVLGKYFAAVAVFLLTIAVTLLYPVIMRVFGNIAVWEIVGNYIGFVLLGSSFIAVGLFISSLTDNQVAAAAGTFGALLFLWMTDWVRQGLPTGVTSGTVFAIILAAVLSYVVYMTTRNIYICSITSLIGCIAILAVYLVKKELFEGFTSKFFGWFSVLNRYDSFAMGILSVSSIVYYISFSAALIYLIILMIDKRRWS